MPNYCINSMKVGVDHDYVKDEVHDTSDATAVEIEIDNARKQLEEFFATVSAAQGKKDSTLVCNDWPLFNLFSPLPANASCDDAYRVWGTKWDALSLTLSKEGRDVVDLTFDTAWSPPESFCRTLSEKFPLLRIDLVYDESGCNFYGTSVYFGGDSISDIAGLMEFVTEEDVEPEEWEEFEELGDYPAKPGTDFADWCTDTGRYNVYQPKKRARL